MFGLHCDGWPEEGLAEGAGLRPRRSSRQEVANRKWRQDADSFGSGARTVATQRSAGEPPGASATRTKKGDVRFHTSPNQRLLRIDLRRRRNVLGCGTLLAFNDVEFDLLTLGQRLEALALNGAEMDEHVATVATLDEPKTLGIIEPLYGSDLTCHS